MTDRSSDQTPWYVASFGELYPLLYQHRDDAGAEREIDALSRLLQLTGDERVLDICCGSGRHLAALRRRGSDAWGLDLSAQLLAIAEQRPEVAGHTVQGDIRAIPYHEEFDIALNLFSSFGYFADDAENAAALQQIAGVLRSGGRLLVDHMNRTHLEATLEPHSREQRDDMVIEHRRRIEGDRVIKETSVQLDDGREHTFTESVRVYRPHEMAAMFADAGLGDVQQYGSAAGDALSDESDRMITVGAKP